MLAVAALVAASFYVASPKPVGAVSSTVVISEFRVRGPNGAVDEFVELLNISGSPVNIGGWKINGSNNAGTVSTRATITAGTMLNAGCRYLVTNSSASGGPYSGAVPGNQTFTVGITDDGGIALLDASNVIIDQVGMSAGSAYKEGTTLASLGTSNLDRGYERKNSGAQDTDNNSADFQLITPSKPQTGCSSNPSGVGAANPSTVSPGDATTLTVAVTPGTNPPSVTLTVTGDLSSIGGSASQAFFDDGAHGDGAANDNTFGFQATVALATTPGSKSLPITITDDVPRTGSTTITLNVTTAADVVISEFRVRGPAGGNDEFIELYNRSAAPVNIGGWKVKGSNASGTTSTRATITSGLFLNPGCHYLLTNNAANGYSGAVPGDQNYNVGVTDDGGIAITLPDDTIVDQVGMSAGSAFKEGTPLASLGANNLDRGYERKSGGSQDTDNNSDDFALRTPSDPQNAGPGCIESAPSVSSTVPANGAAGVALNANITVNFSEPVNVTGTWFSIVGSLSGPHTAAVSGASMSFTLDPDNDFVLAETITVTIFAGQVTDQDVNDPPDNMAADHVFSFATPIPPTPIHDIQGAGHISPKAGMTILNIQGIVTAKLSNGFYMQDPNPDSNDATSEAIFVFTNSAPTAVAIGDAVVVGGTVQEFRPGGSGSTSLTITEITTPNISVQSSGNTLPAPIIIGSGGRVPPMNVIEDDAAGSVETSGVFDPATDGIDFYETLEGMRVRINNAVAVGPRNDFGEIPVVSDDGANASVRTTRGGIVVRANDFNPERVFLDDTIISTPSANVGDHFSGPAVGILDYSFGNFKLYITEPLSTVSGSLAKESTTAQGAGQLAIATFNVENLDPGDPQSKFDELAGLIVNNLKSPDIIAVEEIQDNNGATNDSVVDASQTFAKLIAAIQAAGGPTYDYRQINPVDGQDGGEPGGNIRVGFLFRTDRGLAFVDRPGGGSTNSTTVVSGTNGPELSFSPGRIDPTNSAFSNSRKPLAGEFTFNCHRLFLIANHFNSKGGDEPLFGRFQPPTLSSEAQRVQQAQVVNNFVDSILAADSGAKVVVLGDLNDFEFSNPLNTLKGGVLHALIESLPQSERYTYVFEGNSQALDHILVSDSLFGGSPAFDYDVVHVNSEFMVQASDHDPQVVRLTLVDTTPPTINCPGDVTKSNDPGQCQAVVNYMVPSATDNCTSAPVMCSPNTGTAFPVGTTMVTCTATDGAGNQAQCTFNVTVNDTEGPAVTGVSATPSILGSPNHKLVDVVVAYTATDNCGAVTCTLSVSSNEPVNGTGDGDTAPDWVIVDAHNVKLRAERAGMMNDRVYTITITCTDTHNNTTTKTVTVTVPKSN